MIRNKLWYSLLLMGLFLFSILYDEYITFLLFLVMVIVPIILWILFLYIKNHVDIEMESREYVHTKGIPYDITIHVRNHTVFPITMIKLVLEFHNCFVEEHRTETVITSIDARGDMNLTISASSAYCGVCEYRIKKIRIFDYLTIFQFRKKGSQRLSVAILPNLNVVEETLAVPNANVLVDSDLFSSVKSGDDPSEIYGIRPYEQGDKMNQIHWKLSMKQDALMIKQFGLPINCAVALMADFYVGPSPITLAQIDAIIETLLSLSISLVYQEQIHYMIWYDELREKCERFRVEKEEDCYEAASLIFHCKLADMKYDLLTYHEAQYAKEQYTNIFYITSFLSEDLIVRLNDQRKSAITHLFHLAEQESRREDLINYSQGIGIKTQLLRPSHIPEDLVCE